MRTQYKIGYFSFLYAILLLSLFFSLLALPATASAQNAMVEGATEKEDSETLSKSRGSTFLLLGIDSVSGSSDVIMLSHLDADGKQLKLLQIPRDSYAAGQGKINSIFAAASNKALNEGKSKKESYAAGAKALSRHLSNMLGITVDHYAVLTLTSFRALVDDIGGVPITLPRDLNYDDPAQNLSIHLKAGKQTLDGKAAEGLVRCRSAYVNADYGRMEAQRLFLIAFFKKLKHDTSPIKFFSFIRKAHQSIYTDLSLTESLSLGRSVLSAKGGRMLFAVLTGSSLKIDSLLYEVLPKDSLEKASLWLEGSFSEEKAQKSCVGENQKALAIYLAPAETPFSPHTTKED